MEQIAIIEATKQTAIDILVNGKEDGVYAPSKNNFIGTQLAIYLLENNLVDWDEDIDEGAGPCGRYYTVRPEVGKQLLEDEINLFFKNLD